MNRFLIVIFIGISLNLNAQPPGLQLSYPTCGVPAINQFDFEEYVENLKKADPPAYQKFLQQDSNARNFNASSALQQMFWAYNFKTEDFYQITATLRRSGGRIRVWVEDDSWNSNLVTQTEVEAIYTALEVSTGSGSIDPSIGIVDIDTMLFGQPPNKNGDGIIDFLILDILDNFDPENNQFAFIAGYFTDYDQTNLGGSNRRDLLYLDSQPGIFYKDNRRTSTVLATTAHELQHLIHYNYDTNEVDWVNEGLSELASTYCGYGIGLPYLYLKDTNAQLTAWSGEVSDYSRVGLWTLYIAEQLGLPFIKMLTQNLDNSIAGYNALLPSFTNLSFNQIYRDWTIANIINDIAVDERYGYMNQEARGLKALESETIYSYPKSFSGTLSQYGAESFRLRGEDSLQINFASKPGEAFLVRKSAVGLELLPVDQPNWLLPSFALNDEWTLLLTNSSSSQLYSFNADASQSLRFYQEAAYDDYQSDGSVFVDGLAANKFVVPGSGGSLKKIKFYAVRANTAVAVRVYRDNGSGIPGSQLMMTPFDTTIAYPNSWVDVKLPDAVTGLSKGQSIYVAIEFTGAEKMMGYDQNNSGSDVSFANVGGGWKPISASQLNGVFMIRAIFEGGLTKSGELVVQTPIVHLGPNPNFDGIIYLNAELTGPGEIEIKFYNVLGQKVGEFRQGFPASGAHPPVPFNARDEFRGTVPNGIYFSTITFHNFITGEKLNLGSTKIILLK